MCVCARKHAFYKTEKNRFCFFLKSENYYIKKALLVNLYNNTCHFI